MGVATALVFASLILAAAQFAEPRNYGDSALNYKLFDSST